MSVKSKKEETIGKLNTLAESYEKWINSTLLGNARMSNPDFKEKIGNKVIDRCQDALKRIREGISIIENDDISFEAFCFMNRVIFLQNSIKRAMQRSAAQGQNAISQISLIQRILIITSDGMIVNHKGLKMKALYRVLLIIPYSIPFFISVLIFKGLMNQDFGIINEIKELWNGKSELAGWILGCQDQLPYCESLAWFSLYVSCHNRNFAIDSKFCL